MKKALSWFVVVLMLLVLCSCAQEPEKKAVNATDLTPVIEKLGDVKQVYEKSSSRFVTGETILNYKGNDSLVFIGNLVEYNSLTKVFADYVETITVKNNALAHQHYNVVYDKDKKYVEFCAYVNKTTGEVVEYEIRVFSGNFINQSGDWYAKSCHFNNTMTRDITNKKDVDFGFALDVLVLDPDNLPTSEYTYNCKTGEVTTSDSGSDDVEAAVPVYDPTLAEEVEAAAKRIGVIAEMYDDGKAVYETYTNKRGVTKAFYVCMAEYSSVNDRFTKLFDTSFNAEGLNAMNMIGHSGFGGKDQVFNTGSSYIEIIGYVNPKTGEISEYDLRRIDPEAYKAYKNGKSTEWFASSISIDVNKI